MGGRSLGTILMALWFLLYGLLAVTNFTFQLAPVIMGILAIAVALCLFFGK